MTTISKKEQQSINKTLSERRDNFIKQYHEKIKKNEEKLKEHVSYTRKLLDYIDNKDIDSKYKDMLNDAFDDGKIKTESDVDKYIKNNMKSNKSNTVKNIKDTIKNIKTTKTNKNIKDLVKDIKKDSQKRKVKGIIRDVEASVKPTKKSKARKTSSIINIIDTIQGIKKSKKNDMTDVYDTMNDIDKLLNTKVKSKKEPKKVMQLAKGYSHKADNLSEAARDYVDRYIDIYQNTSSPPYRGRLINDLKLNVFTKLRPSDADDATSLIRDFLKTLVKPVKAKKAPVVLTEDVKKERQIKNYIKTKIKQGFFPTLKDDEENINYIVAEALNKGFTRCSVDFVESMLNEN
jgi:hypothetical protein